MSLKRKSNKLLHFNNTNIIINTTDETKTLSLSDTYLLYRCEDIINTTIEKLWRIYG